MGNSAAARGRNERRKGRNFSPLVGNEEPGVGEMNGEYLSSKGREILLLPTQKIGRYDDDDFFGNGDFRRGG